MAKRNDSVMTIDELSAYLKIAKSTLYKLGQEGRFPGHKVGRHWRFHKDAVDSWLKRRMPGIRAIAAAIVAVSVFSRTSPLFAHSLRMETARKCFARRHQAERASTQSVSNFGRPRCGVWTQELEP